MVLTTVLVPQSVLLPALTQNYRERSNIAGLKTVIGMTGTMIVAIAVQPLVRLFPDERKGFQMTVLFFMIAATVIYWITFASAKERVSAHNKKRYPVKKIYKILLTNHQLLILCLANVFSMLINVIIVQTAVYYFKYNVGNEELYPLFMLAVMMSVIIGSIFVPAVAKKLGKRRTFILGNIITVIGGLFFYLSPVHNLILIMIFGGLMALGIAPTFVLVFSMAADCVEYGQWKSNIRAEGLTFSLIGFSIKLSGALGGTIVTGIHKDAYAALRAFLKLPLKKVEIDEPLQQLAHVDEDLHEVLKTDVEE
ncbi:MAG: MFS transporter [Spirochaetia bacterium]